MKVLDALAMEHLCFRALMERLERCVASAEERSFFQARGLLRVLLPALDRHEEIEDIVFSAPLAAPATLALIESQHQTLGALRLRLLEALEAPDNEAAAKVKVLAGLLIAPLRAHFEAEERLLWPSYRDGATIRSDRAAFGRIDSRVRTLGKTLAQAVGAAP